jgi:hypothetical protein
MISERIKFYKYSDIVVSDLDELETWMSSNSLNFHRYARQAKTQKDNGTKVLMLFYYKYFWRS